MQRTGAHVEWQGAALFEFEDGRIRDLWVLGDMRRLHLQLEEASNAQHAERPSAAADRQRG